MHGYEKEESSPPVLQPLSEYAPSTSAQPVFWNDEATKLLIADMRAREEKSNSGKITKKKMFIEITEKMHKEGYTFTWEQVQGRWKTLVTALKKTKDHNNKSGNDRKTCAFEKELDIMFEGNPSIKPAASSSSCIFPVQEKRKELDGDCTEADENDEKNGNVKSNSENTCNKNKKQHKRNSSEMIDLMKDFITQQQVDKEKQRQERQNIHNDKKAMHEEKMNLFRDMLKQMKD